MGILAEQKQQDVQSVPVQEEPAVIEPKQNVVSTEPTQGEMKESEVKPIFEPNQVVETSNKTAMGNLVNESDRVHIQIVPKISKEVYSFDILDESHKVVYTVQAHTGEFRSIVALPQGNYTYFIKTQKDEMPFSVSFDFG